MARLRVDRRAIAAHAGNLAGRLERVEIEDRQPCLDSPAACPPRRGMYSRRPAASA